ncbi:hypothetical protein CEP53_015364 [Fusarium sp. AF-6]|nr:hypothetical protein CEP53_015364 [Fusarium sp. AF-6]
MRPATILSALTLATLSTAAIVNHPGSNAIIARGHEVEARDANPVSNEHLETEHLVARWEDGSETFAWPTDKVGRGSAYYQFTVTSLGSDKYKVQFWNSQPIGGYTLKFTITAPGLSVSKTLTRGTNTSFEVTKSGDGFQVKVEQA